MEQTEIIAFLVFSSILLLIFFSAAVLFIFQFRKRKMIHLRETEKLSEEHTRQLLSTQLEIQTQTMQHIGREIHDNVGQKLTLASLYTQQLAFENKAPQVNDTIEQISAIINESLAELRQLSKSLTDDRVNDENIVQLLAAECDKVHTLQICVVHFSCNEPGVSLSYQQKNILVRLVQEFLQNSIKHANCKCIDIKLNSSATELTLTMQDDGHGFDTQQTNIAGIGLNNMRKRTELLGGRFHLTTAVNNGTRVTIQIPFTNQP